MSLWSFVCSVLLCSLWEKICHSVFVIMSFCLTKITSFSPSLCYSVFKKASVSLRHSVILSSKKYLSPFVIMSLCLQKNICLSLSHSVILSSKITSFSLRHYVILSKNAPVGDGSGPSYCCCYFFSFCLISIFHKLCYVLPHYLSSIYSFWQGRWDHELRYPVNSELSCTT